MELLLVVLIVLGAAVVVVGAKHGAEAAQREREARWGGFSAARLEGGDGRATGADTEAGRSQASPVIPGPPLRPPDPAPRAPNRSAGAARHVLRAFRRPDGDQGDPAPAAGRGQAVGVASPPGRQGAPASASSRAEDVARRAAGSAAQNATATARAVRATASAALRREPAPIDINRAPVSDLQNLPGVGVRAAERIVAHRERHGGFASVEELAAVEGFDQHRVSRLAPRATV